MGHRESSAGVDPCSQCWCCDHRSAGKVPGAPVKLVHSSQRASDTADSTSRKKVQHTPVAAELRS